MNPCRLLLDADDDVGPWIAERVNGQWVPGVARTIGFTCGHRLIAAAGFFRYNGANLEVSFASESPRWLNRENLWHLFSYPFEQLRVRRITVIADSSNIASRRLIETLGFTLEATLSEAAPDGDQLQYFMLRDRCRWLYLPDKTYALRLAA